MKFLVSTRYSEPQFDTISDSQIALSSAMVGRWLRCDFEGCAGRFKSYRGRTHHVRSKHYIGNTVQRGSPLPPDAIASGSSAHSDHDSDTPVSDNPSQASHGVRYDDEGDVPRAEPKTKKTSHPQLTG